MFRILCVALVALALQACSEPADGAKGARILLMGDSLFAANRAAGASVADGIEARLGQEVVDRSIVGARVLRSNGPLSIPTQFVAGEWDWVVLNGYGNDVILGCGCGACPGIMDRLISQDGQTGAIPDLVRALRSSGARVVYSGYLRSPGFLTPVESCGPIGDTLDARIARLAASDRGLTFVSMADLVPEGDTSFHAVDFIHPSAKGSRAIAARLAAVIAGG